MARSVPGISLGRTVLGDKRVDVAAHVGGIGVNDLVVVAASGGKVLGNPGLRIGDALAQHLIDGYFSDTVFHLTDDQKSLAGDYAQNLSLFLGDGMFVREDTTMDMEVGPQP